MDNSVELPLVKPFSKQTLRTLVSSVLRMRQVHLVLL